MKPYLRIGLAFVMIAGLALWFSPVKDRPMLLGGLAVAIALFVAISTPAVRGFVAANTRLTYGMGVAALFIAYVLMFAAIGSPAIPIDAIDASIATSMVLMIVGIFALMMPRIVKRYSTDIAAAKREQALPKPGFDPIAELRAVLGDLAESQPALIRIVGPWLILDMIALLSFVYVKDIAALLDGDRTLAMKLLFGVFGLVLVHLFLLWTALIKWARFAASQAEMRLLDIPWKSLCGWTWRWLFYAGIFKVLGEVGPFLHRRLPAASPGQIGGLEAAIDLAVTILLSPYCFALIAVALGAADRSWFAAMRGFRVVGRKYFIGAALILAPNALVTWGLGAIDDRLASHGAMSASLAIGSVVTFATMIVGVTYCTRIYLRGAAAGGAGP